MVVCLLLALFLLLGLLALRCGALLLLMHDETRVAFFAVPLKSSKVRGFQLVVGLQRGKSVNMYYMSGVDI